MALTDEGSNGFYMPVAPAYGGGYGNNGNNGFGGDWAWIIILLLAFNGGWGNGLGGGFGGGYNGMMLGYDFPWLLNGQNNINANTNSGFRDAMLNDGITSIRDGISGLSTQLCGCCGDMQMAVSNGFANAETAANGRQMANMQQAFDSQTAITGGLNNLSSQFANCCCENRLGIANLAADISRENCADREALNYGVRDIINNQTAGIQRILDKLCDQELQAERRDNANLRSELMYARGQASQIEQTAQIRAGQNAAVNSLVNELRSCPIPAQPVFGNTPIWTCSSNVVNSGCNCGCGCGGNTF
jgi:hypothetical protein